MIEYATNENGVVELKPIPSQITGFQDTFNIVHPVGEIYTQYPDQLDPNTLYNKSGVVSTWTNISEQYPGCFFRAEGGYAQAFDNQTARQEGMIVAHSHSAATWGNGSPTLQGVIGVGLGPYGSNGVYGGVETRPINYTVRIWKRTA